MTLFGWIGLNILIKTITKIFFGIAGGFGLAFGFDLFRNIKDKFIKRFRSKSQENINKEYIDSILKEVVTNA